MKATRTVLFGSSLWLAALSAGAQTLPTGVTAVPFYDTSKAGLSFKKDKLSTMGMWEVPGKPQHFLVLGYFGYVWSLYPDTSKTYAPGAIKDYRRKQLADFNTLVMKGWEQGALGAAFDPDFKRNRYFYIIYNKYASPADYHGGTLPTEVDGPKNAGLVVIERWKLSPGYDSLLRDTTIFSASHGTGYGSSNMVFGADGYLYITTDSYSRNSWDSTDYMRKILRIDVAHRDAGKLYAIPRGNPYFDVTAPGVKREIFALGFRNTFSLVADYLTGHIWGAEVGQTAWEEVNIIKAGGNYGWADGGDGQGSKSGSGVEGPCTQNTTDGGAFNGEQKSPYSYKGTASGGRTMTCKDFINATWSFSHTGGALFGTPTALPGVQINCIILSPAFRGDPASPFYGYHFVTDVARDYFLAVKEGVAAPKNVGELPKSMVFTGDRTHNGIISFSEDSYGNMYTVLVSSRSGGAFAWHDIYRLSHPEMKPLSAPRDQVIPVSARSTPSRPESMGRLAVNAVAGGWVRLPPGYSRAEVHTLDGALVTTLHAAAGSACKLPKGSDATTLWLRFLP